MAIKDPRGLDISQIMVAEMLILWYLLLRLVNYPLRLFSTTAKKLDLLLSLLQVHSNVVEGCFQQKNLNAELQTTFTCISTTFVANNGALDVGKMCDVIH